MSTPGGALAKLLEVLDRMEIHYQVGGSVASSAHGIPRSTLDLDMVVDLAANQIAANQIEEFAAALQPEFYADPALRTEWKFDLFPLRADELRGVLRACGPSLELVYMRRWAGETGVPDLLDKLLAEGQVGWNRSCPWPRELVVAPMRSRSHSLVSRPGDNDNHMDIDQRIEALTMNLELTAHEVSDLRAAFAERDKAWAERDKITALELSHMRENINTLAQSANSLLVVASRHETRISRVEAQLNS